MKTLRSILILVAVVTATINTYAQEIIEAVKTGNLTRVKELIESNPQSVSTKDQTGRTPLHWACRGVHFEILKYLVENGADVNATDNNNVAPLLSLVTRSHIEGIGYLLTHKADVNIKSTNNFTPLHYASGSGNLTLVKLLLDHGADHSVKAANGDTPLVLAVNSGSKDIIDLLLDKGADYYSEDIRSMSMLQQSARNGHYKLFRRIVEKEGDYLFADKGKNMWTMLDAVTGGSIEIVNLLVDKKVPVEKKADIYGWTLLHYAANKGRLEMVEYLSRKGIDINKRTRAGETAYNLAERNGNKEVRDLLIKLGAATDPVKFPVLRGKYLGQKEPGMKPEIFAPGIISRPDMKELTLTFSPDDQEIFFYRVLPGNYSKIYNCRIVNGKWSFPDEFPLTSAYSANLPFITLDNKKMFFSWNNPQYPREIWVTERTKESWSDPKHVGPGFCLSQTRDGQLYVTEENTTENGGRSPYISKVTFENDHFTNFERIPFPEADIDRAHPCVAPDGSFIIFDNGGGDNIQISFKKKDGTWGKALDLTQYGFEPLTGIPSISRDGKYLFFKLGCRSQYDIGHGDTNRDIWWVKINVIERLRPKE